jgi:small-conductance mechanosensitive channel
VKVDLNVWPDFVFKKEYNLPTLENVEKHINEKGHLENIPSEEEVLKNGISLGEMNSKLLQKIEELTLYMIEMKKRNDQQTMELDKSKKEIELLRKENNSFKNISDRLLQIEKKLK